MLYFESEFIFETAVDSYLWFICRAISLARIQKAILTFVEINDPLSVDFVITKYSSFPAYLYATSSSISCLLGYNLVDDSYLLDNLCLGVWPQSPTHGETPMMQAQRRSAPKIRTGISNHFHSVE